MLTQDNVNFTEITVSCVGKGHVGWSEHHGGPNGGHTVYYSGNEQYLKNTIPVFGKGSYNRIGFSDV
jgi:hypothetical protein